MKFKKIYLAFFLLGVTIFLIWWKFYRITPETVDQLLLYKIDSAVTIQEMEQKGFIDVTEVMDQENAKISHFLQDIQMNNSTMLKIFRIIDQEMYASVLFYYPRDNVVRTSTYLPWEKTAIGPQLHYSKNFEIITEGNVSSVQFHQVPSFGQTHEFLLDQILYSYQTK